MQGDDCTAQPMDVGDVFKGKSRGKDNGKDNNFIQMIYRVQAKLCFEDTCNICGKVGHKKDECWFKDSKGSGKNDGKGTGKKGGKSTMEFLRTRSQCGRCGHKKAGCRSVVALGGGSLAASAVGLLLARLAKASLS